MIKSKYAIELEIEDNIYAIYNNLIMKPIFVDKKFLLTSIYKMNLIFYTNH